MNKKTPPASKVTAPHTARTRYPTKAKSNPINTTEPVAERPSQEKEKSHVSPERLIYSKNTTFHPPLFSGDPPELAIWGLRLLSLSCNQVWRHS
jgi:hypothetical protein